MFDLAVKDIQKGNKVQVSGLWGSSRALFLAGLRKKTGRPLVIVEPSSAAAEKLAEDLRFFAASHGIDPGLVGLFPSWEMMPFEPASPHRDIVSDRLRVLSRLLIDSDALVVLAADSLMQKLMPAGDFFEIFHEIVTGHEVKIETLLAALMRGGYQPVSLVTEAGEFSRRGGIVDIFTPLYPDPVRIEFFGDEIESIRFFEVDTQKSIRAVDKVVIVPASEVCIRDEARKAGVKRMRTSALERQLPREKTEQLTEAMESGRSVSGWEFLAPFFYPALGSLFDYIPPSALWVADEMGEISQALDTFGQRVQEGCLDSLERGRVTPDPESLYIDSREVEQKVDQLTGLSLNLLGMERSGWRDYDFEVKAPESAGFHPPRGRQDTDENGFFPLFVKRLAEFKKDNAVHIICHTSGQAERLRELLDEYDVSASLELHTTLLKETLDTITISVGLLSTGFLWRDNGLLFITEQDIFGEKKAHRTSRPSRISHLLTSISELHAGDFIVHVDHGIGEYMGLQHMKVGDLETDFLIVKYTGGDKLYVPLDKLDRVQKYTGSEDSRPRLDKLGGSTWEKTKGRVKKEIREMAGELLELYAARSVAPGHVFTGDNHLYHEFEMAFEYDETPDQEEAIQAVLADMATAKPMDRLVCGDVGYGKTEVAMRATFKAAIDGKQSVVLVPTTILAQQHYNSFRERFAAFPVTVDVLSRFRSPAEQKKTIQGLKEGIVDVVIGTHRLLSKDVAFKDLGLVVIDEEHRFGVAHKERLKQLRKQVDVLTLTATPIPRTLHMSLMGVRDLSVIETPPEERLAVITRVCKFDRKVIREAILRELNRGGQIYFIHNRVKSIVQMAAYLQGVVPEARFGVAHGQLGEKKLEEVMWQFLHRECDVLVASAIIESGLDIPSANTILINRADHFGLAQLYQLRGRVGRSRHRAYAYLLTPGDETITDVARKRFRVIQELSDLGVGFQLAAKDLEIRGSGNLLGAEQSGQIASVGFDLYLQLLEEAVAEIQGKEVVPEIDPVINLKVSAFIPPEYIEDQDQRLVLYKRMAALREEEAVEDMRKELADRYGELPEPVVNLLETVALKVMARTVRAAKVDLVKGHLDFHFDTSVEIPTKKLEKMLKTYGGRFQFLSGYAFRIRVDDTDWATLYATARRCFEMVR